ncbi:MAG: twitching motility protein PilT [Lachnospiraceae bacterium]|nr:twitching motility protein PilT [Lachnospiraceae bacterium]
MIQIIAGEKGKGKTKVLIEKANTDVNVIKGNMVYLDKSNKHMYDVNNRIRLINVHDYCVESPEQFVGFVSGLISEDHDLEKIYLDSFFKIACTNKSEIEPLLEKIEMLSTKHDVDFVISMSINSNDLPETARQFVIVSL